jgi:hypothetical protein
MPEPAEIACDCCDPWPDGFWFIEQLREAVGLPVCALPITPKRAWEEAIAQVRRLHNDGQEVSDG